MTTEEKIKVMQAYLDGKPIEMRPVCHGNKGIWMDCDIEPFWDWSKMEYRIKPKPTYRPYENTEEMIEDYKERFGVNNPPYAMPLIWVKRENKTALVFAFENDVVWVNAIYSPYCMMSLEKLFNCSTYLDGSPCGKLVEE